MTSLLCGRWFRLRGRVWSFLGMPYPPPPELLREVQFAVANADILGVSKYWLHSRLVRRYLRMNGICPRYVTHAFINDDLHDGGHLHNLIYRYRVALVGRSASEASQRLRQQGLEVVTTFDLDGWHRVSELYHELASHATQWDIVLSGAGVPGRILCAKLARYRNKVALEIGHAMDGLAHPDVWWSTDRRTTFKRMYYLRAAKGNVSQDMGNLLK